MNTPVPAWFKSSHSGSEGDSCVEVAYLSHGTRTIEAVHVRDSKQHRGPRLTLPSTAWHTFLSNTTTT